MKRVIFTAVLLALSVVSQAAVRSVVLNWVDTQNPTGTTYNVKRGNGPCASTPTMNNITTGVTTLTYTDTPVPPGKYCYVVTANYNSMESDPSNTAEAQVKPFPPNSFTITVQ